jgi:hypothetical protein
MFVSHFAEPTRRRQIVVWLEPVPVRLRDKSRSPQPERCSPVAAISHTVEATVKEMDFDVSDTALMAKNYFKKKA